MKVCLDCLTLSSKQRPAGIDVQHDRIGSKSPEKLILVFSVVVVVVVFVFCLKL